MTNLGLSRAFFEAGTLPLLVAGAAHFAGAVLDNFRPTFFTPVDDEVRLTAMHDYGLVVASPGLLPLTVVIPGIYLAISLRCWFYGPTILIAASTACFALAALLA